MSDVLGRAARVVADRARKLGDGDIAVVADGPQNLGERLFVKHVAKMAAGAGGVVLVAAPPQRVALVDDLFERLSLPAGVRRILLPEVDRAKPVANFRPSDHWEPVDTALELGEECAGVVVVTNQFREHMACQTIFNPLKDRGVPVVSAFGYPPMLRRPKVTGADKGMTYVGMFAMAAKWAAAGRFENPSYVEFGTLEGRTMTYAWHHMHQVPDMSFVAFDSFAGILGTVDDEDYVFPEGSFYANRETFMHNMEVCGVDTQRLTVTQCDISRLADEPSIATDVVLGTPAVVNIDVDVFAPALAALEYLSPHMVQGTLLLMDDYDSMRASNQIGERRALREWLTNHQGRFEVEEWRRYGAWGRAFIVHTPDGR